MGINLPPYSSFVQSFVSGSTVPPEISFGEKALLVITHPATQFAQFDTSEPPLHRGIRKGIFNALKMMQNNVYQNQGGHIFQEQTDLLMRERERVLRQEACIPQQTKVMFLYKS